MYTGSAPPQTPNARGAPGWHSAPAPQQSTPPDLVSKRQLLAGMIAAQSMEPSAACAMSIAELRFDVARAERKYAGGQ
eukprot:6183970-Pleurochrysis_carterae.AAC.2